MKKTNYLLILIMLFATCAMGQSQADYEAVLKKCVKLPELQNFFPPNSNGNQKPIAVLQKDFKFPESFVSSEFGKNFMFMSETQIQAYQTEAYFHFNKFQIQNNIADVVFEFYYNQKSNTEKGVFTVMLKLNKYELMWDVYESNFERR